METHLEYLIDQRNGAVIAATEWPEPSTDDLDLKTLPVRLDDGMLARVERIAKSPLPALPISDSRYLGQSLRMMLAVLPRRQSDEIAGELFVAAYERAFGDMPKPQLDFVRDEAIKRCRWFPTVAECLEIGSEWRRRDEAVQRKIMAENIAAKERHARRDDEWVSQRQERQRREIGWMTPEMLEQGLTSGVLIHDETGAVVYKV